MNGHSGPQDKTAICFRNVLGLLYFENDSLVAETLEGTEVSIDDSESATKTPIRYPTGIPYVHLLLWQQRVVVRSSSLYVPVLNGIRSPDQQISTVWTTWTLSSPVKVLLEDDMFRSFARRIRQSMKTLDNKPTENSDLFA